tara:strand:+ start:10582 stop:11262 length:681 start_codon:yes stop_codon:yes gene_type:complete
MIFARGGSKSIPRKNIKNLYGIPLIAHSIKMAVENEYIDEVYVSTDDNEIATISEKYGAKIPFIRPLDLASDESPEWLSWQHSMEFFDNNKCLPEIMISLPATSPLRSNADINSCLEKLVDSDCDGVIGITKSKRHPMFNMVSINESGLVKLFIENDLKISRRQDAPEVFDITTVAYALKTKFLLNSNNIFEGKIAGVEIPEERSLDIDTEFDFDIASMIIEKHYK